jgi:hypothetical protein
MKFTRRNFLFSLGAVPGITGKSFPAKSAKTAVGPFWQQGARYPRRVPGFGGKILNIEIDRWSTTVSVEYSDGTKGAVNFDRRVTSEQAVKHLAFYDANRRARYWSPDNPTIIPTVN